MIWYKITSKKYFVSSAIWQTLDDALEAKVSNLFKYEHNARHYEKEYVRKNPGWS